MNKIHDVQSAIAENDVFTITLDGNTYHLPWADCSPRLAKATPAQRKHFEVSPSGYGIHWPEIDEDLAITPLLQQAESQMTRQFAEKRAKYGR